MKKVFSLVLVLCMVLSSVCAMAECEEIADKIRLEKYDGNDEEYTIESYVQVIGEYAFSVRRNLKKVIIPDSVEAIMSRAFYMCDNLEEVVIPNSVTKIHQAAFSNCNIDKIVISEGIADIERQTFGSCNIGKLVVLGKETKMHSSVIHKVEMHGAMREYYELGSFENCTIGEIHSVVGSEAEKYAKENEIKFVPISENYESEQDWVEVEPKIQGIHGGIILKYKYVDRIAQIAESLGGMVIVADGNISVQKNGRSMAIVNDIVYYMDNGVMVTESLSYNNSFMKIPEKALESVLGEDDRKSEEYKEFFRTFNNEIYRVAGTVETPYGSIAEIYTGGVMHGFANVLTFVSWDGKTIDITKDAPYINPWSQARWSKIELSKDGKILTITYPENKKRLAFSQSPISPERVLWDEGTYVITANLETGEVVRVIEPLG